MRIIIDIEENISFNNIEEIQKLVGQWVRKPVHMLVSGEDFINNELTIPPYVSLDNPYAKARKEQLHYKTLEKRKREV
jgi:hypothetical protein